MHEYQYRAQFWGLHLREDERDETHESPSIDPLIWSTLVCIKEPLK